MATARSIDVRCARDRLLDLLGIGETIPVRDVTLQEAQLTVNVGAPCEIEIDPAQAGVRYALFDGSTEVSPACTVDGTGEKGIIKGPIIDKVDKTFRIHATKIDLDPLTHETFLLETATVRIGLATALPVSTPEIGSVPRCVDHGSAVVVTIEGSQAGATYGLLDTAGSPLPMTPPGRVSGNKDAAITLTASRLTEDTVIRVDVSRTFDASEGRPPLHAVLTAELPIAVRPARGLAVSAVGSPIEPQGSARITIAGSQTSVLYSAYVRALLDVDFVPGPDLAMIPVPGTADVAIYVPSPPVPWKAMDGFVPHWGELPGNGGALELPVGPIQDDSIVVVQAHKIHTAATPLESAAPLAQAAIVLVRPEPEPPLALEMAADAGGTSGTLLASGGQPGVFYHFSRTGEASEIGLPAYFHKRDDLDATLNKGVTAPEDPRRGVRLLTDLVVTRDPPELTGEDAGRVRPLDPLVDIAPLPTGGAVDVMAVKARTGIGWAAKRSVAITPAPVATTPAPAEVATTPAEQP